jgi:hypothetical protein
LFKIQRVIYGFSANGVILLVRGLKTALFGGMILCGIEAAHFSKYRTAFKVKYQVRNAFDICRLLVDQRLEVSRTRIAAATKLGKVPLVIDQIEGTEKCIIFF